MSSNEIIAFLYCSVAIVSAVILLYNAKTISEITARHSIARYVCYSVLTSGLAAIFDCVYTLRELEVVSFTQTSSYILTLIYVICVSLCGMFWVFYSEIKQNAWVVKTKKRFLLYASPLLGSIVLILSTPFTHCYFYFEDLHYQRGNLFIPLSMLLFLYVLLSGITAFVRSYQKEHYTDRKEYRRLFAFALVYLIIQGVQLVLPAVFPYRSVGTMLFFEVFLLQHMKEMIGLDPLTHINNRFAAERQFGSIFNSVDQFEIISLDVDYFKSINDQYGHQEGDKALQFLSEALKNTLNGAGFFARMGGDEFIIINTDLNNSILDIEEKINQNIAILLDKQNCSYRFTISAGYALKDEKVKSVPDLIAIADSRLYERKAFKKKNRKK